MATTAGRLFFSCLFLGLALLIRRRGAAGAAPFGIPGAKGKTTLRLALLGLLLAFHWWSFFEAIRLSSVALGLLAFSTFPLFTALIDPLVSRKPLSAFDIAKAALSMAGVGIVAPAFDLGNPQFQGLAWGMASGLSYAVLSIGNRDMVARLGSLKLAFSEQAFALAFLLPFALGLELRLTLAELSLLALLGLVFTGLSHSLFIDSLKVVRPQAASLASALEPVYGILFSALLLGQSPRAREVAGGLLIIAAMALPGKAPWGSLKKDKKE